MRKLLLAALVAVACSAPEPGRSDVVPIFYLDSRPPHSDSTLEGVEDVLGLGLERVPSGSGGAVVLFNLSAAGGALGQTDYVNRCSPIVSSVDEPHTLAHEIGHALGLEHSEARDNLMFPGGHDEGLTDEQIDTIRADAWWLSVRC